MKLKKEETITQKDPEEKKVKKKKSTSLPGLTHQTHESCREIEITL